MKEIFLQIKNKIDKKQAAIAIVGLGYVGLPLVKSFGEKGFFVYGYDLDQTKIEKLKKGVKYVTDIEPEDTTRLIKKGLFVPTGDAAVLREADVVIICVPTPLRKVTLPDISYVAKASQTVGKYVRRGQLIILESTSYPGTTREVLLPQLQKSGLKAERDFFLCFSPERVNPGDKKFPVTKIPKVVGGFSPQASDLARGLYAAIIEKIFVVSSPEAAEMCKLLENTFRLVNIALVNEFAMVAHKMKVNIWEVIEAAKTKPFGFMPFYPGPGAGGHCLAGNEALVLDEKDLRQVTTFKDLFDDKYSNGCQKHSVGGVDYVKPKGVKVLSFDIDKQASVFKRVGMLSRRKASGPILKVITNDNRQLCLTDRHPMLVEKQGKIAIKWACDLEPGDRLPVTTINPKSNERQNNTIDLIEAIKHADLVAKTRVRIKDQSWADNRPWQLPAAAPLWGHPPVQTAPRHR